MTDLLVRDLAYVNGQWSAAASGATFEVRSPSSGELVGIVPDLSVDDTRVAIAAAAAAWPAWRNRTAKERAVVLQAWHALILQHREALATLMSRESGKVITESRGEVLYGASFVEWFAEEGKRAYGEVVPPPARDRRIVVIRQGIGVVAAITPWNFPLAMITRKVAPALAAGCPVVIKPPAETPLTALALAVLAEQAGLPAGVLNVVPTTQSHDIGYELSTNPLVRKLSFTGSTAVGKQLMAQCASTLKKLSLELGGNAPFIVFDDADIDAAVHGAVQAKYRHNGQTCVCVNRLLVQDSVYDEFVSRFSTAVAALRSGDPLDPTVQVGPLVNAKGLEKVQRFVRDAVANGARVTQGGECRGGLFFAPTVLADATPAMRLAREEVFGPVAPVFRFRDEAEAIRLANDTDYGLAAYFYSRDIGRCWRVAEALECGMVGINEGLISTEVAPFGGVKASGMGREGSRHGLDAYLELKYLCFGGIDP
ncbi:NAD-dependent succinate-semialdehyde dehydrogenase [Gemmatimonas sp.]|jgi:succinate-semialdehyde dehydrogenase/glutarate-semialdehyde dehydrogenase|uniref:NAD-dependent succinate-semialdehyde dehydrogenase n=1 Tax=Gemmatimonas sp. TaxID=1962908 RepID=UPI0037C09972